MSNATEQQSRKDLVNREPHAAPRTEGPVDLPLTPPEDSDMVTGDEPERASERPHRPDGPSDEELAEQSKAAGPQSEVGDDR